MDLEYMQMNNDKKGIINNWPDVNKIVNFKGALHLSGNVPLTIKELYA